MTMRTTLNDYRRFDGQCRYSHGHDNTGLDQLHRDARAAEQSSRELLEATDKAIFKWAWKHGIKPDQARVLLLDRRMP